MAAAGEDISQTWREWLVEKSLSPLLVLGPFFKETNRLTASRHALMEATMVFIGTTVMRALHNTDKMDHSFAKQYSSALWQMFVGMLTGMGTAKAIDEVIVNPIVKHCNGGQTGEESEPLSPSANADAAEQIPSSGWRGTLWRLAKHTIPVFGPAFSDDSHTEKLRQAGRQLTMLVAGTAIMLALHQAEMDLSAKADGHNTIVGYVKDAINMWTGMSVTAVFYDAFTTAVKQYWDAELETGINETLFDNPA